MISSMNYSNIDVSNLKSHNFKLFNWNKLIQLEIAQTLFYVERF